MGRPSEYNEEILTKSREYINSCGDNYKVIDRPSVKNGKVENEPHVYFEVKLPSIEGLAAYLKLHKDTLYEWESKYPEFSDVMNEVRAKQAETLINKGLNGDYNSTIAKLLLTKHGYSDKQETDVTSGGEKLTVQVINYADNNNSPQS